MFFVKAPTIQNGEQEQQRTEGLYKPINAKPAIKDLGMTTDFTR